MPVRQWVLSLRIPLRLLPAAQPEPVTRLLQVVQREVTGHLLDHAGLKPAESHCGAFTLIRCFGSAANINIYIYLHCLVLDEVYRRGGDGVPVFVEAGAPTLDELHALLHTVTPRLMRMRCTGACN